MIILFYSNKCQFCVKMIDYLEKNNLLSNFKMFNIDTARNIPANITMVPTIVDPAVEAPLEGNKAFEYIVNQKYFDHPTNNVDFWQNTGVPKPPIEEDSKALQKFNFNFASIDEEPKEITPVKKQVIITDKKSLTLLKLKKSK
jgi:hypothetical protein